MIKPFSAFIMLLATGCGMPLAAQVDENQTATTENAKAAAEKSDASKPAKKQAETTKKSTLPQVPEGVIADWIIVDKSDRALVLYKQGKEIARYTNIRFGDAPYGHKQFQGDEKTPEGIYQIDGRNPGSSYHLSLRISYPNAADTAFANEKAKSAGGDIFIHGQPNGYKGPAIGRDWTDGCIAVSNEEIRQIWSLVPDGAMIKIQL